MFSYYGSKSKIIDYYPPPRFDKIIEPFAGSARYSLKYFEKDVLLVDKYPVVIKVWEWLQKCSEKDILSLPRLKIGQKLNDFYFDCEEAKWLCGFIVNVGSSSPRITCTTNGYQNQKSAYKNIVNSLHKIRHWRFRVDDYLNIENEEATWFIDPPYQFGGEYYVMKNKHINFQQLADWCKTRKGQSIVCENSKADWMPFYNLKRMSGQKYITEEVIWTNTKTSFGAKQCSLF